MKIINPRRFIAVITSAVVSVGIMSATIHVIRYPELYSTTLKYQLKNDISAGDITAIEYYNTTYAAHGINLFEK